MEGEAEALLWKRLGREHLSYYAPYHPKPETPIMYLGDLLHLKEFCQEVFRDPWLNCDWAHKQNEDRKVSHCIPSSRNTKNHNKVMICQSTF